MAVSVATVSGLSVAGSAIGFVFQILLAAHFGAGAAIDSYLFSISAPTFLAGLGAAALSYLVVPTLVQVESTPSQRSAVLRRLRRRVGGLAVVFAFLGVPAALLQPMFLPEAATLRQVDALPVMIMLGWAIGSVQLFGALFTIELNAARRPVTAALLALPPNLGAIAAVAIGAPEIVSAPIGVLVGSSVAAAVGQYLAWNAFRSSTGTHPSANAPPPLRPGRVIWTLLAMSCFSAYAVIDAFWAPRAGAGTLASLGYAQRLVIGLGSLVVAGPSAILTPRFASRLRDNGGGAFLREALATMIGIGVVAFVVAAVLAVFAPPLIHVVFARGAFSAEDVVRVSTVFRAMLPGFCAMLISVVATRAIFCLAGVERAMAFAGLSWSLVYATTCGLLLQLGDVGFGISYSLAWAAHLGVALLILRHYACRHTS